MTPHFHYAPWEVTGVSEAKCGLSPLAMTLAPPPLNLTSLECYTCVGFLNVWTCMLIVHHTNWHCFTCHEHLILHQSTRFTNIQLKWLCIYVPSNMYNTSSGVLDLSSSAQHMGWLRSLKYNSESWSFQVCRCANWSVMMAWESTICTCCVMGFAWNSNTATVFPNYVLWQVKQVSLQFSIHMYTE